ncbi:hypothetical protein [Hydrogenophaga pseudoflava]|jgi:hypothetical protein|uniref:Uncharacterized protein n=1 Tax=Hydrogenophaga pseudoflava TaxID=47421 RepID=A0A4P6WY56_HYDPS|nr:hypothetical protein [Hydrogenophaga pseudoflava]MCM2337240.1 hypothetical protein [Lysobacter sp.]QBM28627.1 hypothetical protein HPF_13075 [Hydrogenophaga pseudoflava]
MKHLVISQELQSTKFGLVCQKDSLGTELQCEHAQAVKEQCIGRRAAQPHKHLSADELKPLIRYPQTQHVGAQLVEATLVACGNNPSRACVVEKLRQTKNFNRDGIMAPLTFGPNIHQSGTRPILLKANVTTGKFERAFDFLVEQ